MIQSPQQFVYEHLISCSEGVFIGIDAFKLFFLVYGQEYAMVLSNLVGQQYSSNPQGYYQWHNQYLQQIRVNLFREHYVHHV